MKKMVYKGIKFDEYDKGYFWPWAKICPECAKKNDLTLGYGDVTKPAEKGKCGVEGCENTEGIYFIDFTDWNDLFEIEEEGKDDINDVPETYLVSFEVRKTVDIKVQARSKNEAIRIAKAKLDPDDVLAIELLNVDNIDTDY